MFFFSGYHGTGSIVAEHPYLLTTFGPVKNLRQGPESQEAAKTSLWNFLERAKATAVSTSFRWVEDGVVVSLRIQVYPEKGINPTFLFLRMGLEPSILFWGGVWILRVYKIDTTDMGSKNPLDERISQMRIWVFEYVKY